MLQYSLLERFHGALLGAALTTERRSLMDLSVPDLPVANRLSLTGVIDRLCSPLHPTDGMRFSGSDSLDALLLTPVWLYCHESWRQRKGWLAQFCSAQNSAQGSASQAGNEQTENDQIDRATLWLFGEMVAQVLRPNFQAATCIPTLLDRWLRHSYSGAPAIPEAWQRDLYQVNDWLKQRCSLSSVVQQLGSSEPDRQRLLLALFCFLDTPTGGAIALQRVGCTGDSVAQGLTGVLIGAHTGIYGFPVNLLWQLERYPDQPLATFTSTQLWAETLLRSWSGELQSGELRSAELYPGAYSSYQSQRPVITAPR